MGARLQPLAPHRKLAGRSVLLLGAVLRQPDGWPSSIPSNRSGTTFSRAAASAGARGLSRSQGAAETNCVCAGNVLGQARGVATSPRRSGLRQQACWSSGKETRCCSWGTPGRRMSFRKREFRTEQPVYVCGAFAFDASPEPMKELRGSRA